MLPPLCPHHRPTRAQVKNRRHHDHLAAEAVNFACFFSRRHWWSESQDCRNKASLPALGFPQAGASRLPNPARCEFGKTPCFVAVAAKAVAISSRSGNIFALLSLFSVQQQSSCCSSSSSFYTSSSSSSSSHNLFLLRCPACSTS